MDTDFFSTLEEPPCSFFYSRLTSYFLLTSGLFSCFEDAVFLEYPVLIIFWPSDALCELLQLLEVAEELTTLNLWWLVALPFLLGMFFKFELS